MYKRWKRIMHNPPHWLENVRKQLLKYDSKGKCHIICCRTQWLHKVAKTRKQKGKNTKDLKVQGYITGGNETFLVSFRAFDLMQLLLNGNTLTENSLWLLLRLLNKFFKEKIIRCQLLYFTAPTRWRRDDRSRKQCWFISVFLALLLVV